MTELKTIEAVRAAKWAGNHFSDSGTFKLVDDFILKNIGDRDLCREAVHIASKDGMGIDEEVTDEQLSDYLEELQAERSRTRKTAHRP